MAGGDLTTQRKLAIGWAAARVLYAAGVIVAPKQFAGPWLGRALDTGGGRVAARALVVRDGLGAAGVAIAALRGQDTRPWTALCVGGDLGDIAATMADRSDLPDRGAAMTPVVAGFAALSGAALVALETRARNG